MSIYAYVGMPGSGKTYDTVANQILPALKAGRRVVTNIPLQRDLLAQIVPEMDLVDFPIEQIASAPEMIDQYVTPGCVLVIDECWRLWPAGTKVDRVPLPFKALLAEHRHMVNEAGDSTQIVLVTQDLAQLGMFARQLVEQTFYHTKLSHVGASGSYRIDVYQGAQTGQNPPRSQRIREIFGRYDSSTYKLYKSHTKSASGASGANEKSVDSRGNIWRRPMLWVSAAACLLFLIWGVPKAVKLLHNPTGKELRAASGATGAQPSAVGRSSSSTLVPSARGAPAASAAESSGWRVSGVMLFASSAKDGIAFITDGLRTIRLPLALCLRSEFEWSCPFEGFYWSSSGMRSPIGQDPLIGR